MPSAFGPVRLRPVEPADIETVHAIYASTRADEMAQLPWSDEQKHLFLRMQSMAQQTHYQAHYPHASLDLVLVDDEPVGRLYVHRSPSEFRLMDISLLPSHRGQGLGTRLLAQLRDEARAVHAPITAHVAPENPARRWYARLGFREAQQLATAIFIVLDTSPSADSTAGESSCPAFSLTESLHG